VSHSSLLLIKKVNLPSKNIEDLPTYFDLTTNLNNKQNLIN
jgi:hypothetical protein